MINYHPNALIMACRFAYGFRTIVPIAIGASSIPRLRFTLFNGMAAITWATTFVEIGYHAGGLADDLLNKPHIDVLPVLSLLLVGLICAAGGVYLAQRKVRTARL
jgi:membrane protein DedA with SNARE-associated domain